MRAWKKMVAAGLLCGLTLAPVARAVGSEAPGARNATAPRNAVFSALPTTFPFRNSYVKCRSAR